MAVPTILSVTPTVAPTRGDMLASITGTGFRVAPLPEASGPTTGPGPVSVSVLIGTAPAKRVDVLSDTRLDVLLPLSDPGFADITVQNLDDDGVAIAGEHVTATNAIAFEIPKYTSEYESDLGHLSRTIMRELKRQTFALEVYPMVATDFDDTTGDGLNITKMSKKPSFVILGPDLTENRFYSLNAKPLVQVDPNDPNSDHVETRVPVTVDVHYQLIGVTDKNAELMNLMTSLVQFFHRNKMLVVTRVPGDASKGTYSIEMDFEPDGMPKRGGFPNASNIRQFGASFLIRGFDIEDLSGLASGFVGGTAVQRSSVITSGRELEELDLGHAEKFEGI